MFNSIKMARKRKKTYFSSSKESHLEESKNVQVPEECKYCVYYDAKVRVSFYYCIPPCQFIKDSDICKRWYKEKQ